MTAASRPVLPLRLTLAGVAAVFVAVFAWQEATRSVPSLQSLSGALVCAAAALALSPALVLFCLYFDGQAARTRPSRCC